MFNTNRYIVSENDELRVNNQNLINKVIELSERVGYLQGYIAGREVNADGDYEIGDIDD